MITAFSSSHHRLGHDAIPNSPGSYKAFLDFYQCLANPFPCYPECRRATRSSWVPKGLLHFAPIAISYHRCAQVRETDHWEKHIEPRGKYYFTRYYDPTPCSAHLMCTQKPVLPARIHHSPELETGNRCLNCGDSRGQSQFARELYKMPILALKHPLHQVRPVSKKTNVGYLQVGVETYGGGIWHSWFDRDLSLAGRVVVAHQDGSFQSKLIKVDRPLLRIPTLAIHRKYPSCLHIQLLTAFS